MSTVLTRNPKKANAGKAGSGSSAGMQATGAPRQPPAEATKDLVQLFKLLADDTRLKILYYLMQESELNVRTLCELLGQSQPAVSHHLALLRVAGLLEARRDGKHNFYRILPARFEHLLQVAFAGEPHEIRRVRFENCELSLTPLEE